MDEFQSRLIAALKTVCDRCGGSGKQEPVAVTHRGRDEQYIPTCYSCSGTGQVDSQFAEAVKNLIEQEEYAKRYEIDG